MCEQCERVGEVSKVLNENPHDANGAKEGLYFGEVYAGTPINNFVNSGRVRNVAFQCANMPYNGNLLHA